jgi:hypothetical protein
MATVLPHQSTVGAEGGPNAGAFIGSLAPELDHDSVHIPFGELDDDCVLCHPPRKHYHHHVCTPTAAPAHYNDHDFTPDPRSIGLSDYH